MAVTAQMVKELRDLTGAGPLDCKKALDQFEGDMEKAIEFLEQKARERGEKIQGKNRTANEGTIGSYVHHDQRLAVIVEVNCETDFVGSNEKFQAFAKDVAMHIANLKPQYVKREDVPEAVVQAEREVQLARAKEEGKPDNIAEKIVDGRMNKWYEEIVLLEQAFIKDDEKTIEQLLQETVSELGETITISRFARFAIGESPDDGDE